MESGRLVGIGVGPGDPELLTLKAIRLLQEADMLLLPNKDKDSCMAYQIARQAVKDLDQKPVLFLPFPMTKDIEKMESAIEGFADLTEQELLLGKTLCFLTIGDPSVYSTYLYLQKKLQERGYRTQMIPGIASFLAVAARLGISLGERGESISVIPGSYAKEDAANYPGTRIYMKSGKELEKLKAALEKENETHPLLVWAVSNCGQKEERLMTGLENLDPNAGYFTTVIVKPVLAE